MADAVLQLLKDEFEGNDVSSKRRAAERMDLVAKALGPERVRSDLLPWIESHTDQDDEILFLFASKCKDLTELVGGVEYVHALVPVLEKLLIVEETVVREAAVECAKSILSTYKSEEAEEKTAEVALRLAKNEWFTARMSACALIGAVNENGTGGAHASSINETYTTLCRDETPMVRRAAASELPRVIKRMSSEEIASTLLPLYEELSADPQESVSLNWISNIAAIVQSLTSDADKEPMINLVKQYVASRSWRVRFTVAQCFDKLCEGFGPKVTQDVLVGLYRDLLRDPEGEVRSVASEPIINICLAVGPEAFVQQILPLVKNLVKVDQLRQVQVNFAKAFTDKRVLSTLGPQTTRDELTSLWETFLRGTSCTCAAEVRLIILNGMDYIIESLGANFVAQTWATALQQLFEASRIHSGGQNDENENQGEEIEHPQWRLRVAIVEALHKLASTGDSAMEKFVLDTWTSSLVDEVCEVRLASAKALAKFCEPSSAVGSEKVASVFVPRLLDYFKQAKSKYHHRINFLHAFETLVGANPSLASNLFPAYTQCLDDRVPNVRLTAINIAEGVTDEAFKETFSGQIKALAQDPDPDVAMQAKACIKALNL